MHPMYRVTAHLLLGPLQIRQTKQRLHLPRVRQGPVVPVTRRAEAAVMGSFRASKTRPSTDSTLKKQRPVITGFNATPARRWNDALYVATGQEHHP